jgi:hypothetical protein
MSLLFVCSRLFFHGKFPSTILLRVASLPSSMFRFFFFIAAVRCPWRRVVQLRRAESILLLFIAHKGCPQTHFFYSFLSFSLTLTPELSLFVLFFLFAKRSDFSA